MIFLQIIAKKKQIIKKFSGCASSDFFGLSIKPARIHSHNIIDWYVTVE